MATTRRALIQASAAASALAGLAPADAESPHAFTSGRGAGPSRDGVSLIVAGVVIETVPGAAPRAAARLLAERALELHGGDGDRRIAAVFTGAASDLEALAERLVREHPDVLGVFPTYVADEPDDPVPGGGGAPADGE